MRAGETGYFREGCLKGQKLKQSVTDNGGIPSCSAGQYEKMGVLCEHKACNRILVSNPNYNFEPENKLNMCPLTSGFITA